MLRGLLIQLAAADLAAWAAAFGSQSLQTAVVRVASLALALSLSWRLYRESACWGWGVFVAAASLQLAFVSPEALTLRFYLPASCAIAAYLLLSRRRRGLPAALAVAVSLLLLPASFAPRRRKEAAAARQRALLKGERLRARALLADAAPSKDIAKINEAAAALQQAIAADPGDLEAYRLLFRAAHLAGDMTAVASYDDALVERHARAARSGAEDPAWYFTRLEYAGYKLSDDRARLARANKALDVTAMLDVMQRMIQDDAAQAELIQLTDDAMAALTPEQRDRYEDLLPILAAARAAQAESSAAMENVRLFVHKVAHTREWLQAFGMYARGMDALIGKEDALEAERLFTKAVSIQGEFAEPQMALAEISIARGAYAQASMWAQSAIAILDRSGPTGLTTRNELLTRAYAVNGTALWRSSQALALPTKSAWDHRRSAELADKARAELARAEAMGYPDSFIQSLRLEMKPKRR